MRQSDDYHGPERRRRERWHFKREVSWGDVGLALGLVVSALLWGRSIETRLIALETSQTVQQRVDSKQDEIMRDSLTRIESAVREQGARMDTGLRDIRQWMIDRPAK
ncbi:MAG: hypothetical protein IT519_16730 [Burkholderiales bacterium]|nr:hypothetical protein [Burkholderiales bacterium]